MGVSSRRLTADQWLVGKEERPDLAPFTQPVHLDINSLDFSVWYGVTDKLSLSLTVPFSHGTQQRTYGDGLAHKVSGSGLGDINLISNYWLRKPGAHPGGNVSVGIGVKIPTGRYHIQQELWLTDATSTTHEVDQSIQLGDGGWGIILQAQSFLKLFPRGYGYLLGWYLVSLRQQTDVFFTPQPNASYSGVRLAVPDVFNARVGVAFTALPKQGLSTSLGLRIDGIPKQDIFGGGDDAFRRPAVVGYVEPGVALTHGADAFTLSVPIRVWYDFRPSLIDQQLGKPGGGDLANYLIFLGYTHRF